MAVVPHSSVTSVPRAMVIGTPRVIAFEVEALEGVAGVTPGAQGQLTLKNVPEMGTASRCGDSAFRCDYAVGTSRRG